MVFKDLRNDFVIFYSLKMAEKLKMINPKMKKFIEPIKVDEPYSNDPLMFDGIDEFTSFYRENQEEMDKLTTYKLNKMYKVNGYRIKRSGKKKDDEQKELELTKEYYKGITKETNGNSDKLIDELRTEMDKMKNEIQQLTAGYNEIIKFMNGQIN
jgi:hypothetical protein